MSLRAMTWALEDAPVTDPTHALVLVALADRASSDGRAAWPSQSWLARRARVSERSVRRVLSSLENAGVIIRGDQRLVDHLSGDRRPVVWDLSLSLIREPEAIPVKESYPDGPGKPRYIASSVRSAIYARDGHACVECGVSNQDLLTLDHVVPIIRGGSDDPANLRTLCRFCNSIKGARDVPSGGTPTTGRQRPAVDDRSSVTERPDAGDHHGGTPTSDKPKPLTTHEPSSPRTERERVEFDEFWAAYPKRVSKGYAVSAYRAARKLAPHAAIMTGLLAWAPTVAHKEKQFIPYPATWLKAQRWEDEVSDQATSKPRRDQWMDR